MQSPAHKTTERNLAQAQAKSRRALAERGGKTLQVRLEAGEVGLLAEIRAAKGFQTDKEAVAWAIRNALR